MPAMGAMAEMKGGSRVDHEKDGRYRAHFDLPMNGTWTLKVDVHAPAGAVSQRFSLTVGTLGVSPVGGATGEANPVAGAPSAGAPPGEIDHYTCSMHPSVKEAAPGKCPICGMDLIPVTKEQQQEGVVMIDDARRQLIGVRTEPVVLAPMRKDFRVVGHVTYDESSLADVNLKVHGWITKLYVSQTGQKVTRGQTLLSLYSPELYNAEQDFLLATQGAATPSLAPGERSEPGRDAGARRAAAAALARPRRRADRRAGQARHAVGERPDRGARERLRHREERRRRRVGRRRHAPLSHRGADQGVDRGPGLRGRPSARARGPSARQSRSTTCPVERTTRRSRTCTRTSTRRRAPARCASSSRTRTST